MNQFSCSEQERILQDYIQAYDSTKEIPRALYGIGANTIYLLENLEGYNIVCIIDSHSYGQIINGYNVYSHNDKIIRKIQEIVIVAAYISLPIIYERIKHIENEGIAIKTVFGKLVSECIEEKEQFNKYVYPNEEELIKKINQYDMISFSALDVLLNSRLLYRDDLFELIEIELLKFSINVNFKENRILSEQKAYDKYKKNTKISNIYEELKLILNLEDDLLNEIYNIELKVTRDNIFSRKSGLKYLNLAIEKNKIIILNVVTYLEFEFVKEILEKNNINNYDNLIISYENNTLKTDDTLYIVSECINKEKIFCYMNYYDMLLNSNSKEILDKIQNISDKWLVGDIFTDIFDSPFALNKYEGKIQINDTKILSKLCLFPLVLKFTLFSINLYSTIDNPKILYTARDGYLFYKIYEEVRKLDKFKKLPKSEYILASRQALKVPNMLTEENIKERFENIFETEDLNMIENMIYKRFNINLNLSNYDIITNKELLYEVISKKDEIIENAKKERKEYLNYLNQFQLNDFVNIILFDLVTRGTISYNFSKIVNKKIIPICLGVQKINNNHINLKEYNSLFGYDYSYNKCGYFFLREFLHFENIFSEDNGCFIKIKNNKPIFAKEKLRGINFEKVHNEIIIETIDKIKKYDFVFLNNISPEIVDILSKTILDDYSVRSKAILEITKKIDPLEDAYATLEE